EPHQSRRYPDSNDAAHRSGAVEEKVALTTAAAAHDGALTHRLHHREDVPCRVFEPGDGRSIAAGDAALVGLDAGKVVVLEADAAPPQLIDGLLDIGDAEVQYRESRRRVVRLRIDEHAPAAAEAQLQAHRAVAD